MSARRLKPLNWAGDTIVEVMIVTIVLGTVLAGGYRIAVGSLQSIQLVQERNYALKIAEGQLEQLKATAETEPDILAGADSFCLKDDMPKEVIRAGIPTNMADDAKDYGGCKQDPNNGDCDGYCYFYGIKPVGNNNFTASVRWDGPRGNDQQVQLSYRIYP